MLSLNVVGMDVGAVEKEFVAAVNTCQPVASLTHNFYRYPARFSPLVARAAIRAFTRPGDVVMDPFMGGGTTLVEACALGRKGIGIDLNSLAVFVSKVKTTPLLDVDLKAINSWARAVVSSLSLRASSCRAREWAELGYQRNINCRSTWPIRKTLEQILNRLDDLRTEEQRQFARCVALRTAQWALDCRAIIPSAKRFRRQLLLFLEEMTDGAREYASALKRVGHYWEPCRDLPALCLKRSAVGMECDRTLQTYFPPKLILTSPPYPGVHVLYHRWQVRGRKETPAPFWISNSIDGNGASYYTFGDRKRPGLSPYYENLRAAFTSLSKIADRRTLLVQIVAFTQPSWQIPMYLDVMEQSGFRELNFARPATSSERRIWRKVPNRKWYAEQRGNLASSNEVVLFHQVA